MKKILKISILSMLLFTILSVLFINNSNAAIQIKEGAAKDGTQSITVNEMFDNCYNMRNQASTLGNNNLDPHLCNGREWGAMWYLGMSSYGETSLGLGASLDGKDFKSLNGNMSGVMLVGGSPYIPINAAINNSVYYNNESYNSRLYDAYYRKYVDRVTEISEEGTRGMALQEVKNWTRGTDNFSGSDFPVLYRNENWGVFDAAGGCTGDQQSGYCYRPVIWN